LTESDPKLLEALRALVDPGTRGDPSSPLRWSSKSLGKLAAALVVVGHQVSDRSVGKLLKGLGFRLHANRKTREGADHPDRDAQFRHISQTAAGALAANEPVISIDAKKRELVGDFKAVGREWEPTGRPVKVRTHDFKDKELGHAIPYGVYDLGADQGMISVGISNETSLSTRSVPGGSISARRATPPPPRSRSPPTQAARTAAADGCGRSSCRSSPTSSGSRSASATSRREPASGTKLSIACSAS
jgi:hypothetical protein